MPGSGKRLPRGWRVIALVLSAIGLISATYVLTLHQAVPELYKAKARINTQKAEIRSLTARLQSSKTRQEVAEQEANVMRRANQILREGESNRQAELNHLQTELDFYQRLAGTSGAQSGLAIYHLELSPTGSDRVFHYVLTLTQNLRRSAIISGSVRLDVEGTMEDRLLSLPWSQVTDGNQPEPTFRFKYFQQLEGYLELPDRFEPSRLKISLKVAGQSKVVSRGFDWKELTESSLPAEKNPGDDQQEALEKELPQSARK